MNNTENFTFAEATPIEREISLHDTVSLMESSDYKARFVAEVMQLEIRVRKLDEMIRKYEAGTLSFTPSCPIELLKLQLENMNKYLCCLCDRAQIEGINIHIDFASEDKIERLTLITRNEAVDVLLTLVNSGILDKNIEEKLAEISTIIEDEEIGYHFWGADHSERVILFTATRVDLITDEMCEECNRIADKYSFTPSEHERVEIEAKIDDVFEAWVESEE